MWLPFAFLSAFFAALVTILAKLGLKGIDSTFATTVRASIMFLSLGIFSLFTHRVNLTNFSSFSSTDWLLILLSGLAGAASWLFYFAALKNGPTTSVAIIDKGSLILIALFSFFIFKDHFSFKTAIGVILMFAGILLTTL